MSGNRFTPKEAAAFLGLTVSTVYAYTERGLINAERDGRRLLYRREELERWKAEDEAKKAMGYRERWAKGITGTLGYRDREDRRK